jgi:hypothetical protein
MQLALVQTRIATAIGCSSLVFRDHNLYADLNEAALRRTLARARDRAVSEVRDQQS